MEKFATSLAQMGGTLLESCITVDPDGAYELGESADMLPAMKAAVETVVPTMWLAAFDKVRHNPIYPSAENEKLHESGLEHARAVGRM